jgi:Ca-activated chloride channel family protein
VRITLAWDTDETDMDLWVTEPTGEKCDYSHNRTANGGMVSADFTGGYGPEEYLVRYARPGVYEIQANFYDSRAQSLTGPTTAQATVITDFGRPNEARQTLTPRLTEGKEVVDIGSVRFGGGSSGSSAVKK